MKHPAPVMAYANRLRKKLREQSQDLRDVRIENTNLRTEAAVFRRRSEQWQRTAMHLAAKVGPRAMDHALLQCQWDEIQDLPETKGVGG